MGFWGEKIFENDFTLDVKDTIESGLSIGVSIREIIGDIKDEIDFDMLSIIEQNLFWIASSTTLWENGRKDSKLFKKGIESIDLFLSDYQVSEELKAELVDYRNKLHNQPPKKRTKRSPYICPWKIGDVFALPIEKDENVDNGLNGRYFIFIKRDERVYEKNV